MSRVIHSLWPWTPVSGCTATAEPDIVTGLTATPSGSTTINLAWDADTTAAPNEASEYEVWRSTNGSAPWTQIATVSAPTLSYSDTSLSAGTTRHYYIIARNCFDSANPSTSASATTAAGSIAPDWDIDFSSGTPSGYTLTRASSGTYVDSSGYIASASTNAARLTHNSSGSRLGLLVEEQRANLVLRSQEFNTTWVKARMTVTANSVASPDNTTTAETITEDTISSTRGLWQSVSTTAGASYTLSCYIKKGTQRYVCVGFWDGTTSNSGAQFDLDNITATAVWCGAYGASSNATITDVGNGWYRCSVTCVAASYTDYPAVTHRSTASTAGSGGSIVDLYAGSTSNYTYVWGFQMEAGTCPTAYIPTTTASVTREADLAHVLDSSITSWGDPGALVVHFYPPSQAGTLLSTDDASTAQVGIEASTTTAARAFWSSGSTATGTIGSGVQKAVHYWNGSTSKFCINGGTVQSGTNNFSIGNTDFVTLGAEATDSSGVPGTFSQYANCIIRKVEFYSGTLTDANLQTITT